MTVKSHFESIMYKYDSLYLYLKLDKDFGWDWNETSKAPSGYTFTKYIEACKVEFINDLKLLDDSERRIALEGIIKSFNISKSKKLQVYFVEKLTPQQVVNLIPRAKDVLEEGKDLITTDKEWDLLILASLVPSYLKLIDEYLNWANVSLNSPLKGTNKSKNQGVNTKGFKWDQPTTLCFFHLLRDSGLRPKGDLNNIEYCRILCDEFEIDYKDRIPKMFEDFHYGKLDKVKLFVLQDLNEDLKNKLEEFISTLRY